MAIMTRRLAILRILVFIAIQTAVNATMSLSSICNFIEKDLIGTDAGGRGMKSLIVPGDLEAAARLMASLDVPSTVIILSGFPCCVEQSPPTETDGPPGTFAIARAVAAMGHQAVVVTDTSNSAVFGAAFQSYVDSLPDVPFRRHYNIYHHHS